MEIIIQDKPEDVARKGADFVSDLLRAKPSAVLGLATGSTPVAMYRELVNRHRDDGLSFKEVHTFNLDEYIGLDRNHPQSYHTFMWENLFNDLDILPDNVHLPDGSRENPREVGPEYEALIRARGGIDLQVLGIGSNGHIGFNEPSSSLASRTRIKTLTPSTIRDNSRFFKPDETQPELAITMGIGTILEARSILLLVTGAHKAEAVKAALEGPITAMCPASALQLHPRVRVLLDEAAAEALSQKDYYRFMREQQERLDRRFGPAE